VGPRQRPRLAALSGSQPKAPGSAEDVIEISQLRDEVSCGVPTVGKEPLPHRLAVPQEAVSELRVSGADSQPLSLLEQSAESIGAR
jgi:hypothetical protein